MRLLLVLDQTAQRLACADYYTQSGCTVDAAADAAHAESLLRFRTYDAVLTDLEDAHLLALARRRNPAVLPVVLTTRDSPSLDATTVMLTKPFALSVVLDLALVVGR